MDLLAWVLVPAKEILYFAEKPLLPGVLVFRSSSCGIPFGLVLVRCDVQGVFGDDRKTQIAAFTPFRVGLVQYVVELQKEPTYQYMV